MLQKGTVTPETLERLNQLMKDERLSDFFLVGGTALSLQLDHRISVDIDLFSLKPFDENTLLSHLQDTYGFRLNFQDNNTLKGEITNIQVDLITHGYPLIKPLRTEEGMRLASFEDIAAMKLNAIVGNGTRAKDFIDIVFLSGYMSLNEMITAYETKYSNRNALIILKALDYTEDVNKKEFIELLHNIYSWETTERHIKKMLAHANEVFQSLPYEQRKEQKQSITRKPTFKRGRKH